jgi:hypothetical protein
VGYDTANGKRKEGFEVSGTSGRGVHASGARRRMGTPGDENRTERSRSGERDARAEGRPRAGGVRGSGGRVARAYPSDFAEHAGHDACAVTQLCANGYARDLLPRSVVSAPRKCARARTCDAGSRAS